MAIIPFNLILQLLRLNRMGRIERLKKGWTVHSAEIWNDAGGVAKKTEVDGAPVGSMVLDMWLTTSLSAVPLARLAETAPDATRAVAFQQRQAVAEL
jgi:hypothetical protein